MNGAPSAVRPRRALSGRLAVLLALLLLNGCQPLYIPPVPAPLELPRRHEVDASAALAAGRPLVRVGLVTVLEPDWLAVQWFSPDNREVASESHWIEPSDEGSTVRFALPDDVPAGSGRWRVVLSVDDLILRQLSLEVP